MAATTAGATVIGSGKSGTKGEAMTELFNEAITTKPSFVVVMDLHRDNDPSFIPKLVWPLVRGEADITIGVHEEGGVLALHANLFALNWKALSTPAGADFFRSMAGGDDHEISEAGLRLMAVFFDTSNFSKPVVVTNEPTKVAGTMTEFYDLLRNDRPNAMAMLLGLGIGIAGFALMGWAIGGFLKGGYANVMLMIFSSTLVIMGVLVIISASLHSYLRRSIRQRPA